MIYAKNRKDFFKYIYQRNGNIKQTISLNIRGDSASDKEAAEIFKQEFTKKFSARSKLCMHLPCQDKSKVSGLMFNSNELTVWEALLSCSNNNSSPGGISFKLLKAISKCIIQPLNIIFQQSFYEGIFPQCWKHAIITPLYKGKGDRSDPSSYRPISIPSYLGKVLEKVVTKQLIYYLNFHGKLHSVQHGYTAGRSTLSNLLKFDKYIADCLNLKHSFDIFSFDFCKPFDKAPHQCVIMAASELDIDGKALAWIASYLEKRTQQVKVVIVLSSTSYVMSGLIQGSVLGPTFYVMLSNSLLSAIKMPLKAFADDLKFLADVTNHTKNEVQAEIDKVSKWADVLLMPLSIGKSNVMHYG